MSQCNGPADKNFSRKFQDFFEPVFPQNDVKNIQGCMNCRKNKIYLYFSWKANCPMNYGTMKKKVKIEICLLFYMYLTYRKDTLDKNSKLLLRSSINCQLYFIPDFRKSSKRKKERTERSSINWDARDFLKWYNVKQDVPFFSKKWTKFPP